MLGRLSRRQPAGGALVILFFAIAIAVLTMLIVHVKQVGQAQAQAKAAATANANPGAAPANPKDAGKQPTPAQGKPGDAITAEFFSFAVILLFTWLMSCVEARKFGLYGLGSSDPRRMMHLIQGLITGFVALSLLVFVLYLGHWITFGGVLLHGARPILVNGFLWFIAFVLVGFFEEFTFRGYIQYTLARGIGYGVIGFFISAFIWNFGFGAVHGNNPGESPIGLVTAGLIGFIFCISLYYTGSLWWAIGFHATWDWAESYFYGTADSGGVSQGRLLDSHPHGANIFLTGGTTGPEGSVFCIIVALLVGVLIYMTQRPRDGRPRYPLAR
jgi:membrane protease YdiL (CAAX protease family)